MLVAVEPALPRTVLTPLVGNTCAGRARSGATAYGTDSAGGQHVRWSLERLPRTVLNSMLSKVEFVLVELVIDAAGGDPKKLSRARLIAMRPLQRGLEQ